MCYWDSKQRLWLQLIPFSKALGKMNEPPPVCEPAEKLRSLPSWVTTCWKRFHKACVKSWPVTLASIRAYSRALQRQRRKPNFMQIPVNSRHRLIELCKWGCYQTRLQLIWRALRKRKKGEKLFRVETWEEQRKIKMSKPNYTGTFHMVEQDNMDSYLAALGKTFKLAFEWLLWPVLLLPMTNFTFRRLANTFNVTILRNPPWVI